MGGILDALSEIISSHGEVGADLGDLMNDPDAYFGLDLLDPETLVEFIATGGELPPFWQEVVDVVNDPSVHGVVGLVPGVGVQIQTGLDVLDDLVDTPSWVAGGVDQAVPVSPMQPVQPSSQPSSDKKCCCCCHKK